MPQTWCEVAFVQDATDGSPLWRDVSADVEWQDGVRIARRRTHELDDIQPGTLSLTLLNADGRYTAGNASSPHYPNVTINRPIRIRARWPNSVNLLAAEQAAASTAGAFSVSQGTVAVDTVVFPSGQTSSARWNTGTLATIGQQLRIGATSVATATETGILVTAGLAYSLRLQVRRDASLAVSVNARIRWYGADGALLSESAGSAVALSTTFQAVSASATAPAGAVWARVVLANTTTTAGSVAIYAGAWQFEQAAAPTTWVSPGVEYVRFTGFVDRWPHAWANGVLGRATITATDRFKLLDRAASVTAPVSSAVEQEILTAAPLAFYPLTEPAGATEAGNYSATTQPSLVIGQAGASGTIAFGDASGLGGQGARFDPVDSTNGKYLVTSANLYSTVGGASGMAIGLWVELDALLAGDNRLVYLDDGSHTDYVQVSYNTTTNALAVTTVQGGTTASASGAVSIEDGTPHFIAVTLSIGGSAMAISAYVDGSLAVSGSPSWPSLLTMKTLRRLWIGGISSAPTSSALLRGVLSHVAIWNRTLSSGDVTTLWDARDALDGAPSGTWASLILGWAGVTKTDVDTGLSQLAGRPDGSPLQQLKKVAKSEGGLFFIARDGTATFHDRGRRQRPSTVAITLTADQVGADLAFDYGDTLLINDVSVGRSDVSASTRVTDAASIAEYGTYAAQLDTLLYGDTQANDRGAFLLSRYAQPQVRVSQIAIEANSQPSLWPSLLASEIDQRASVTGLPSSAPSSSLELWVEGVQDVITDSSWTFTLDPSPASSTVALILDDPIFGLLDFNVLGW